MCRRVLIVHDLPEFFRDLQGATSTNGGSPLLEFDSLEDVCELKERVQSAQQERNSYSVIVLQGHAIDEQLPERLRQVWAGDDKVQVIVLGCGNTILDTLRRRFADCSRAIFLAACLGVDDTRQLISVMADKWYLAQETQLKIAQYDHVIHEKLARVADVNQTLQRVNSELVAARQAAESASRIKSDFLATMSHEIRSPMTAILGFAELLLEEGAPKREPPARIHAIETIIRNGRHLLSLINDILDVSKIESGRIELEMLECSPLSITEDVIKMMRQSAGEKGVFLRTRIDNNIPATIHADPTRLRQILVNLVGNALKFTERGGVLVEVRLLVNENNPQLQFEITDSGIGITPDQMQRLFKPFTQADCSTTRKYGGTGLGLTICKRLIEMMGGSISVDSTPGEGSTFRFSIATGPIDSRRQVGKPAAIEPAAIEPAAIEQAAIEQAASPALSPITSLPNGTRILLAEDGVDNQRLIRVILKKAGAEVTIVQNGLEAFHAIQSSVTSETRFQLVLMDMQMPVLDGYEATKRVRSAGHRLPIIALTANAMAGDRAKCINAGCNEFLTKPIDRGLLLSTIDRWMDRSTLTASDSLPACDSTGTQLPPPAAHV